MPNVILTLAFNTVINESLQRGDTAYYAKNGSSQGQFTTYSMENVVAFGVVTYIESDPQFGSIVKVMYDNTDYDGDGAPDIPPPTAHDYIMFGKNQTANSSSLIGYYAEIKLVNNSKEKAELFAIGSQINESSK